MTGQGRRLAFAIAGAGVIVLTLFFMLSWVVRQGKRSFVAAVEKKEETIDVAALVVRIRNLNRLETASMRVMHVSTIRQSYGKVPQALAGDELTFMAVGDVVAGVDLSTLTERNVRVVGKSVTIELPPSEVLMTRVDNQQSRVMNRETGFLRKSDPGLESRARANAEISIRQEALKRGILPLASKNAEGRLADLARLFGVEQVTFVTRPPGAAETAGR
jgi:hypothetical protein